MPRVVLIVWINLFIIFIVLVPLGQMDVAVKTLRVDAMGHGEQEFMREARIMVTLNHPCIVKLIGVTRGKPLMLVSGEGG